MEKKEILYDGLSVKVYATQEPEKVIVNFTDEISAFNKVKRAHIEGKGKLCNAISSMVFEYLAKNGVHTHFIKKIGECEQLCQRIEAIPIHVIVRNVVTGSMAKHLGIKEGVKLISPVIDLCLHKDELGNPLINDYQAIGLGLLTKDELEDIYDFTKKINDILLPLFDKAGIILADYKIQYGRLPDGSLILDDDITPDSARFWDKETGESLDRDRFRRDNGQIAKAYGLVLERLCEILKPEQKTEHKCCGNHKCHKQGIHEDCGVFAAWNIPRAADVTYYGLHALQHRGQEGCGIVAVEDHKHMRRVKGRGLVTEVFNEENLQVLKGNMAIGHVRYGSADGEGIENVQPLLFRHASGDFAIADNGSLVNAALLRRYLEERGSLFQSRSDCEILAHLVKKEPAEKDSLRINSIIRALNMLEGSFTFVIMTKNRIYAARDKHGFHPLSIGKIGDGYIVSSETCAFSVIGAEFIRDVEPGEVITIDEHGVRSNTYSKYQRHAMCSMEYIYFSRPDSDLESVNVHAFRKESGRILYHEAPAPADIVVGVPDSSLSAAMGYAEESGLPYEMGLIKNRYIGRTFIKPSQELRDKGVKMKLSPVRSIVGGKRVVLIDDSIVRGTTSRRIVSMLKEAGATEVHLRIASPEMKHPCCYGVDVTSKDELISAYKTTEEVCKEVGADSLAYLSSEALYKAGHRDDLCLACFDGKYPTNLYLNEDE